jgi:exosortase/archaeosortase family protein
MIYNVVRQSLRTTQAVNAFILLAFTVLDAWRQARPPLRFVPGINHHGLVLFSVSCVALALAAWTWVWPLAVLALCLSLGALLSFGFGRRGARAFYPALAGLGVAVFLMIFVPRVDGALRITAARLSAGCLDLLGLHASVAVRWVPFLVVLVVERGARVFDVATECNGFGIILSSVVLAVVMGAQRRYAWVVRGLLVGLAFASGLAFNTARIVAISVAALRTEWDYAVIHEGLGTAIYLVALGVAYGLCALPGWLARRRLTAEPKRSS